MPVSVITPPPVGSPDHPGRRGGGEVNSAGRAIPIARSLVSTPATRPVAAADGSRARWRRIRMGKRRVMFASAAVVVGGIGVGGIATAHGHDEQVPRHDAQGVNEVPASPTRTVAATCTLVTLDADSRRGLLRPAASTASGRPNRGPHPHRGGRASTVRSSSLLFDLRRRTGHAEPDARRPGDLSRVRIKRVRRRRRPSGQDHR